MDANRRGSGFMRNKISKPLFRVTKPSKPVHYGNSKIGPTPSIPNDSVRYPVRQSYNANPPSIQKESSSRIWSFQESGGDVNVDKKAEGYILNVAGESRFGSVLTLTGHAND